MSIGSIIKHLNEVRGPSASKVWVFAGTGASVTWPVPAAWAGRQIMLQADGADANINFGPADTVSADDTALVTGSPPAEPTASAASCGKIFQGREVKWTLSPDDKYFAYKGTSSLRLRCWIADHPEVD